MFFMHFEIIEELALALLILGTACGIIWLVRKRRNVLRIPVVLLSSPIAVLATLFIAAQALSYGCESNSYSVPLYSPNHKSLVRLASDNAGALGGSTAVELLTHYGFGSTYIYRGYWGTVDLKDVRWLDDHHITIQYEPYRFYDCTSTRSVKVTCVEKPPPTPTATLASPDGNAVAELHKPNYQGTDAVILTGHVGYAFVYVGEPDSVVWAQTKWLSNHELQIAIKSQPRACGGDIGITVTCVPY